jgi:WD domain, G-beta repeat
MSGPGITPYGCHAGPVLAVAYAPDGETLATGGADGTVRIWYGGELSALCGGACALHVQRPVQGGAADAQVQGDRGHRLAAAAAAPGNRQDVIIGRGGAAAAASKTTYWHPRPASSPRLADPHPNGQWR